VPLHHQTNLFLAIGSLYACPQYTRPAQGGISEDQYDDRIPFRPVQWRHHIAPKYGSASPVWNFRLYTPFFQRQGCRASRAAVLASKALTASLPSRLSFSDVVTTCPFDGLFVYLRLGGDQFCKMSVLTKFVPVLIQNHRIHHESGKFS
jgi:hypothetical protein